MSDSNSIVRVKPTVHDYYHWTQKSRADPDIKNSFQSVDGDKIFVSGWNEGRLELAWFAADALAAGGKSLAAKQDKHCITLERKFCREVESKISQVPYRKQWHCCALF